MILVVMFYWVYLDLVEHYILIAQDQRGCIEMHVQNGMEYIIIIISTPFICFFLSFKNKKLAGMVKHNSIELL